jgi:(p)ppGpp synthase/HD superfamily hydrolase
VTEEIARTWDQTAPGSLERAIAIAVSAHTGQKDKVGAPYILHPLRVMLRCRKEVERIAAVLHDVVEDGPGWTFDQLRIEGFSDEVLEALSGLTKRPEEDADYMSFVRRASTNSVSKVVKLADIEDNLDVTRLPQVSDKDQKRLTKYLEARAFLLNQLP